MVRDLLSGTDETLLSWRERRERREVSTMQESVEYARRNLPETKRAFREHNLRCARLVVRTHSLRFWDPEMLDPLNEGLVLVDFWEAFVWNRDRAVDSEVFLQDLFRMLDHLATQAHTVPPGGIFTVDPSQAGSLCEADLADLADELGIRRISPTQAQIVLGGRTRALWVARIIR